ncbi:MAG: cystathionine beta-lyase [Rhodospirillaceae bacterium]
MKKDTKVIRAGHSKKRNAGIVNTPVYHASTVVFDSIAQLKDVQPRALKGEKALYYGRLGTPTHWTLEEAITELAGGADTILTPSGVAACALAILGCVKAGDHILVSDSAYEPTRKLSDGLLKEFGVVTTYYDPCIGSGIEALMRDNTRLIFCESPGSHTFEVQDIPAIAKVAHARKAKVAVDNTWASLVLCRPLDLGADITIEAGTKYLCGHSDAVIGAVTATADALPGLRRALLALGYAVGPDDVYLTTRGLRTLAVRLARHQQNGLMVARWLQGRPEVKRVLYPALPEDPGHALWKRDFQGASGLMGVLLHRTSPAAVAAMVDNMEIFSLGYSWGGFESLIAPSAPKTIRTAVPWTEAEPGLRLHIGLEDPADLIDDLAKGFARLTAALPHQ